MKSSSDKLSRRTLFAGAGTAAAVAAVAATLPGAHENALPAVVESKPVPAKGGGYSVSEHVQHYYKTTRI